jgi:putative cardiolipin synthase
MNRVLWMLVLTVLGGCAALPIDVPRPESFALTDSRQTTLGRAFTDAEDEHSGLSGFHLLDTGTEALQARAALADVAERSLDLQYFSIGNDRSTDVLLWHIAQAGQRGVRVRILLDDVHPRHRDFARRVLALVPNAELRLFNPFLSAGNSGIERLLEFAADTERLNRRMHNKLWVADNAVAVVGGRNLGDEYFDVDAATNFSDLDVLAVGPVVQTLSRCFDAYWNNPLAVPFAALAPAGELPTSTAQTRHELDARLTQAAAATYQRRLQRSGMADALRSGSVTLDWARAEAGCDPPDKPLSATSDELFHTWPDADGRLIPTLDELLVVSPYFIPSGHALDHLQEMSQRGVRVAVLTNSLASTDSPVAHGGYARYRAELLRRGVELYELRPSPGDAHPLRHRWRNKAPATLHVWCSFIGA